MANANVNNKSDVEADEPEIKYIERDEPWRSQPSVLEGQRYSIGKDELDLVD
jgi:hypothetical protein